MKDKILYVDDETENLESFKLAFIRKYEVHTAVNTILAEEILYKEKIKVVVCDQRMEEETGTDFINRIKPDFPDIVFTILTGFVEMDVVLKAINIGNIYRFMTKPMDINEMRQTLENAIDKYNLQEKNKQLLSELQDKNAELEETMEKLLISKNEIEESEERYRTLLNYTMYPLIVTNINGSILFANPKTLENFDIKDTTKENYSSIDFWYDKSQRIIYIKELTKNGFVQNLETKLIKKNKQVITVILSSTFIDFYGEKAILTIFNDISKEKQLEQQLITNTIDTEEKERQRFAQEIHDGIGPLLSAAKMYAQWIQKTDNKQDIPDLLKKVIYLIEEAHKTTREISHNLSPHLLQHFGFVVALKSFIDQTNDTKSVNINFIDNSESSNNLSTLFSIQKQTILYRVICECISNSLKHANATEITIEMNQTNNVLEIVCTDNGIGFDIHNYEKNKKGLGIFNIKHRLTTIGGNVTFISAPDNGTKVIIILNLN